MTNFEAVELTVTNITIMSLWFKGCVKVKNFNNETCISSRKWKYTNKRLGKIYLRLCLRENDKIRG